MTLHINTLWHNNSHTSLSLLICANLPQSGFEEQACTKEHVRQGFTRLMSQTKVNLITVESVLSSYWFVVKVIAQDWSKPGEPRLNIARPCLLLDQADVKQGVSSLKQGNLLLLHLVPQSLRNTQPTLIGQKERFKGRKRESDRQKERERRGQWEKEREWQKERDTERIGQWEKERERWREKQPRNPQSEVLLSLGSDAGQVLYNCSC